MTTDAAGNFMDSPHLSVCRATSVPFHVCSQTTTEMRIPCKTVGCYPQSVHSGSPYLGVAIWRVPFWICRAVWQFQSSTVDGRFWIEIIIIIIIIKRQLVSFWRISGEGSPPSQLTRERERECLPVPKGISCHSAIQRYLAPQQFWGGRPPGLMVIPAFTFFN